MELCPWLLRWCCVFDIAGPAAMVTMRRFAQIRAVETDLFEQRELKRDRMAPGAVMLAIRRAADRGIVRTIRIVMRKLRRKLGAVAQCLATGLVAMGAGGNKHGPFEEVHLLCAHVPIMLDPPQGVKHKNETP